MNFEIAIPSYRRAKKLRDQTLAFLSELNNINTDKITVFVADYEEKKEYEEVLRPGSYGKIVVGLHTLSAQRNFISSYYPEDTQILQCDDDIKRIKLLQPRPLIPVINQLFDYGRALGVNLWSIYPVNNLFFCSERVVVGKIFCVGCFFGLINKKDGALPPVCTVEDKWRSLFRYQKDGNTMRYEGMCPDTNYNAKGGLYDHRLLHRTQEVRSVINDYSDLCHLKTRKNGVAEVIWKPIYTRVFSLPLTDEPYPLQPGTLGVWEAGREDSSTDGGVSDRRNSVADGEVL
jgi:hypothetical protein